MIVLWEERLPIILMGLVFVAYDCTRSRFISRILLIPPRSGSQNNNAVPGKYQSHLRCALNHSKIGLITLFALIGKQ